MAIEVNLHSEGSASLFFVDDETKRFVIPTFVQPAHWMLGVGIISSVGSRETSLVYYNSLSTSNLDLSCKQAVVDVARVLSWFGSSLNSRLFNLSRSLSQGICDQQRNEYDCGVFVAITGAAIVSNEPIPRHVHECRYEMAKRIFEAV